MPELLLHFSIIFAISAPLVGIKRALLVSLIALSPDIDALFHVHRSMTHSIAILSIVVVTGILISYGVGRGLRFSMVSGLALLSHPLLDAFQSPTPLFYPVSRYSYHISPELFAIISEDISLRPSISVIREPIEFTKFQTLDAPIFTDQGFIISLMLIGAPLVHAIISCLRTPVLGSATPMAYDLDPKAENGDTFVLNEAFNACEGINPDVVTILIPTLNEEKAIGRVLQELRENGYKKILVVDGYSSDRTVEIARENGAEVIYQVGHGKAAAIKTGIERVETPYVLIMDGDGTYDPRDIGRLLKVAIEHGCDEVIGYRTDRRNIPALHRFGNKVISTIISLLMGQRIKDPCSGMYLLRTDFARNLEILATGFDVEAEIVCQSLTYGRVAEVPVSYRERVGKSKLKTWSAGFRILLTAFKIAWLYNPILPFSFLGTILGLAGLGILAWQLYLRYVFGEAAWSVGWTWFGLVLLILGVQSFTITIISLMLKRMERRIIQLIKERRI